MGAPLPDLQANAAACLGNLADQNFDNQVAIARTGAAAPLCTLVRDGADVVKEQAAGALWSLTVDNKPNKDTVTKLGGIEPLISLIVQGSTDNSLEQVRDPCIWRMHVHASACKCMHVHACACMCMHAHTCCVYRHICLYVSPSLFALPRYLLTCLLTGLLADWLAY